MGCLGKCLTELALNDLVKQAQQAILLSAFLMIFKSIVLSLVT